MDNLVIIEAREQSAVSNKSNGDWLNILDEPVHLQQGDALAVKTAVIDSQDAAPGSVIVEEDTIVEMQALMYHVNVATTAPKLLYRCFPNFSIDTAKLLYRGIQTSLQVHPSVAAAAPKLLYISIQLL